MKETFEGPLVSAIITTYNRRILVQEAIQSVLDQTYKNLEVIVVDDGSIDGTTEYIKTLDLPIKIIKKTNGGISSARNKGLKESRGELIAFLDSDDLWIKDKIQAQVRYLNEHSQVSIVYTDEYIEVEGKIEKGTRFERNGPRSKMLYPAFVDLVPIQTSSVMGKRGLFDEVGDFNENLTIHEDSEMWNRISEMHDFGFIEKPLVIYRWNKDLFHLMNVNNREKFIEEGRKYLKAYEKNKKRILTMGEKNAIEESKKLLSKLEKEVSHVRDKTI